MRAAAETDVRSCTKEAFSKLAERGYKGSITSIQHLPEIKDDIEERRRLGLFNEEFFQERLNWFDFRIPDTIPEAKSIIVVAVPRPQSQVTFNWNGRKRALIIPPTYVGNSTIRGQIQDLLTEILGARGYHMSRTALPLKLLAVRSGLAEYGRNNICYVHGMGSFFQIVALYSDLPCTKDNWREPQTMQKCQSCQACRLACPTGAIPSDRFLLRAERCIVFHNERKGSIPFPAWIDPSWHNCLEGCLRCQKACPDNRNFLQWIEEIEEFCEEETALLLKGTSRSQLSATTVRKLEHIDFIEDLDLLPRNLGVLFKKNT